MNESPWETKIWGKVWHLFNDPGAAVSILQTEAGYQCSTHFHDQRANVFAVVSGEIEVHVWNKRTGHGLADPNSLEVIRLGPGEKYTVRAGDFHRFRVIRSGAVVEVYWLDAEVRLDDIVRADVGGPVEEEESGD